MRVPPPAPTMAAADSDEQERPEHEPEFVIHVVDDHGPPAPPGQRHRPVPHPYVFPPEQPRLDHDDDGPRVVCTYCVAIKVIHFVLVMFMVFMTLGQTTQLPEEYRKRGHGFLVMGPIIIGVVASLWMMLNLVFDK
ncbi:hypothetical protein EJB05_15076 [Eragrostis curvula]|uniref:Uncharacterized protein n=1 Tax=Eragrostis curvula TaxID=38414 RepID=A0A5J9W087_9POAL|nr:hypothetical protein EJB05_15076 [Eragrostis curvula]